MFKVKSGSKVINIQIHHFKLLYVYLAIRKKSSGLIEDNFYLRSSFSIYMKYKLNKQAVEITSTA
ncbi:hypothetical protein J2S21_000853 [Peribacillus cavernae]|nr:hypothetical protein [Peribacillus cavernae]